ncbi:DivIVA domain-containing protein [Anaerorhabdus furcosa]|uniref:DivIVA domain-containing protein n=1 Tax=Anaerorhabdus furcosa TaxID=118967 RepID=A0A1T4NIB1_9FIRM|nr:DivIVA domain-containing protein [Anaerorhabdus furcosa]SJZ78863.1 DivIVA domain-containing protein [Anaerorhabdus furcosa]
MSTKLNLDIQTILDKQFNIDFKGYSATEVDSFLDMVLEDYETFQDVAKSLNDKVVELERINATLRAQCIELEGKSRLNDEGGQSVSQLDILKRLSRLEQAVYSKE